MWLFFIRIICSVIGGLVFVAGLDIDIFEVGLFKFALVWAFGATILIEGPRCFGVKT